MEEEEQFENIDLNDDNICSVCKLETETGTLSFCHVCFELSMEGTEKQIFFFGFIVKLWDNAQETPPHDECRIKLLSLITLLSASL